MLLGNMGPDVEQGASSLVARFLEPFFLDRGLVSQEDMVQQLPVFKDIFGVFLGLVVDEVDCEAGLFGQKIVRI